MTKAKKDNKNPDIQSKNGARKSIIPLEDYFCFSVSKKRPVTIEGLKRFMEDAIYEIQQDKEIRTITQYLLLHGIPRMNYYRWLKKYNEWMQDYHDVILTILADRNIDKIKDDYRYIHFIQPYFDEYVYGQMAKFWAALKKDEDHVTKEDIKEALNEINSRFRR